MKTFKKSPSVYLNLDDYTGVIKKDRYFKTKSNKTKSENPNGINPCMFYRNIEVGKTNIFLDTIWECELSNFN